MLVEGYVAEAGANRIADGEFETPLAGIWNISSNHTASSIGSSVKLAGSSSLHLVASRGGGSLDSAIWQTIQGLVTGQPYTLSYWYLPGTNGTDLTVRLEDSSIASTRSLLPLQIATPGRANSSLLEITQPVRITAMRRLGDGSFVMEWNAQAGQSFQVLYSDAIGGGQWNVLDRPVSHNNGVYSVPIESGNTSRFFRVHWMK